jgi:hypothetical protein
MLRFSLIYHRRTTKTCSVFLPFTSVYRPNRPVTGPYRAVYRLKSIELAFQFRFWICSVLTGFRGLPTGLPIPVADGSVHRFGKVNPDGNKPLQTLPIHVVYKNRLLRLGSDIGMTLVSFFIIMAPLTSLVRPSRSNSNDLLNNGFNTFCLLGGRNGNNLILAWI